MPARPYQTCANCVMDTSDAKIEFDDQGICDHCRDIRENVLPRWETGPEGRRALEKLAGDIRSSGKGRQFDCILGLSGGLDSSYMLHLIVTELGLRPLVFHVDGGWNTDLAVNNIQMLVEKLGLDLYTEVINWEDMRDFQLAWFKSGVPHLDLAQDHAFIATLYHFADQHGIRYIMNGGNISTECVRNPKEWLYYGTDMAQINAVRRRFCTRPLKHYPFSSVVNHKIRLRYLKGVKVVKPLDNLPYTRQLAIDTLSERYGWRAYPQKHFESRFTKFFEGYWLPTRFGYDTRRVQYSSLILTGQMSREEALVKLETPAYDPATIDDEFEYIANKLRITIEELRAYHTMPKKWYWDYPNQSSFFDLGAKVLKVVGVERSIKR
jgi:N-acetyl sugar amidotransferase